MTIGLSMLLLCRIGSVIFGNGTFFNETICDNLSSEEYREEERYVEYQVS